MSPASPAAASSSAQFADVIAPESISPEAEVGGDVAPEAVEAPGLALAPVPHLCVCDRDAPVRSYALPDLLSATTGIRLEVLVHDLLERRHLLAERRLL